MTSVKGHKFQTLDAMRGVAAVAVAGLHYSPYLPTWHGIHLFHSGGLAVDLFFVLSGFVLSHAYDRRLAEGMELSEFAYIRLIRLLPLIWLGVAAGALALFLQGQMSPPRLFVATAFNAFALPAASWSTFPTNGAVWSLFYELLANFAFAAGFSLLRGRRLRVLILLGWLMMAVLLFRFHHLAFGHGARYLAMGFARVTFSFFVGVSLARSRGLWLSRVPSLPAWLLLATLALLLLMPFERIARTLFDLLFATLLSPCLVMLGAASRAPNPQFAHLSAEISYPLYATHMGIMNLLQAMGVLSTPVAIVTLLALPPASYALWRWYDVPLRRKLTALYRGAIYRAA